MATGEAAIADVELLLFAICRKFDGAYPAHHHAKIMASRNRMDSVPNWSTSLCCHGDMTHFPAFKDEIERVRQAIQSSSPPS